MRLITTPSPRTLFAAALVAVACVLAASALVPAAAFGVTREAVLTRAEIWVSKNVPYSQSRYATNGGTLLPNTSASRSLGYRTDCSGFVSMAYGLQSTSGLPLSLDTASLPYRCTEITGTVAAQKAQLKPGDIMLKPKTSSYGGHVVIFVRWTDASKTAYVAYHESGSNTGTVASKVPYPYWNADKRFRPFRYKKIEDTRMRRSRTWLGPPSPVVTPQPTPVFGDLPSTRPKVTAAQTATSTP